MVGSRRDDVWMADVGVGGLLVAGSGRRRSVLERRLIVAETVEAGASAARVALQHEVNANQVFQWRRLLRDGKLGAAPEHVIKVSPVSFIEGGRCALRSVVMSRDKPPPSIARS
jgi:transposase-like protein